MILGYLAKVAVDSGVAAGITKSIWGYFLFVKIKYSTTALHVLPAGLVLDLGL